MTARERGKETLTWCCERAATSGFVAVSLQSSDAVSTAPVVRSMARKIKEYTMPVVLPAALALVKAWSAISC